MTARNPPTVRLIKKTVVECCIKLYDKEMIKRSTNRHH